MKTNRSLPEICISFEGYFGTSFMPFLDPLYSALTGRVQIDLFRFDDYLHGLYGNYEEGNQSMEDIISEKYGALAALYIKELIKQ